MGSRRRATDLNRVHRRAEGQCWHEKHSVVGSSSSSSTAASSSSRPGTRQALSRCSGRSAASSSSSQAQIQIPDPLDVALAAAAGPPTGPVLFRGGPGNSTGTFTGTDAVGDLKQAFWNLKSIDRTTSGKELLRGGEPVNNNLSQQVESFLITNDLQQLLKTRRGAMRSEGSIRNNDTRLEEFRESNSAGSFRINIRGTHRIL